MNHEAPVECSDEISVDDRVPTPYIASAFYYKRIDLGVQMPLDEASDEELRTESLNTVLRAWVDED